MCFFPRKYIRDRTDELKLYVIPTGTNDIVEMVKDVNWREYDPLSPPLNNDFLLESIDILDETIVGLSRNLVDGDVVVVEMIDYVYFF